MGNFDLAHLQAVHAYLFQDIPGVHPGEIRGDAPWSKHRKLEGDPGSYEVTYAPGSCGALIHNALKRFYRCDASLYGSGPKLADKLAQLYGDLDFAHGFYEGNSRTLREFFRQIAASEGYFLVWGPRDVGPNERNALYIARDVEVFERAWPGLTPKQGMASVHRAEYEASLTLPALRQRMGDTTLSEIIKNGLTPAPPVARPSSPEYLYNPSPTLEM